MKRLISVLLTIALLLPSLSFLPAVPVFAAAGDVTTGTLKSSPLLDDLMEEYTSFIVTKHQPLGGSHYAYTEAVSDTYESGAPNGEETTMFRPGSQLVLVELEKNGDSVTRTEKILLEDENGVIRDPDVSEDGTKVLFSWKKDERTDDFHLYEYDLVTNKTRQLTFGLGVADTEPKYLPDGNIVFSSCRTIQTVDCFKVPVSNLYLCGPNGENIVRVGYDQVHTTYPTVTDDGRVLYTRWDYNDRNQLYVQGVFQMFPDGTGQTEVWGNNANFPSTLLHTRQVKGVSDKYISIASGHHVRQAGKLVILDTSKGRNDPDAVTLVFPDGYYGKDASVDHYGEKGPIFKYPYSISEDQFLVTHAPDGWASMSNATPSAEFSIYLMDMEGNKVNLVPGTLEMPAGQIVPVAKRTLFERASMVNFGTDTGTFYVGNVYEGEGMEGVAFGTAKYLRVVALDYRAFAIGHSDTFGTGSVRYGTGDPLSAISTGNGSWDVKRVLGIVPIEEDGSALFKVPSETPVFFQVLDAEGQMIQSMRSWSTLMPGETFSCVGCHEDKNTVPPAVSTTTMAMAKGVQELQPEPWQTGEGYENYDPYEDSKGFSYLKEIQPILDESCIKCHSNQAEAFDMTDAYTMVGANTTLEEDETATAGGETVDVIKTGETWQYFKSSTLTDVADGWNLPSFKGNWSTAQAPFGDRLTTGTTWNDTTYIWIRYEFDITDAKSYKGATAILNTFYDDYPDFFLNGQLIFDPDKWVDAYTTIKVKNAGDYLVEGKNVLAIRCQNTSGGRNIDTSLSFEKAKVRDTVEIFGTGEEWKYTIGQNGDVMATNWMEESFSDAAWSVGKAGFGNVSGAATNWKKADSRIYLRKTFTLTKAQIAAIADKKLVLDIYFDQNPEVYINGEKVFSHIGWNKGYKEYSLNHKAVDLLKEGENVIAMTCEDVNIYGYNTTYLDAGLFATEKSTVPFSLEGRMMNSAGIVKEFPLSYLVLTASTSLINTREWVGSPENHYTNWISSMSQCEILDPYQYGSAKSNLIQILKDKHQGVSLSDSDLRKIMAWIDLAVPAFGDYFEGNTWNNNQIRWADEYTAKRDYYVSMNEMARKARAKGSDAAPNISIQYKSGDTVYSDTYDFSGAKKLELPTYYKAGDVLTVTLPEGEHYLGLTMDSLMGEAILYVPGGTYTFTVPEANNAYNRTFKNQNNKTITARVVGSDELGENYNLARNPYDLTDVTGNVQPTAYPHATTDSNYGNLPAYFVRNAIDGVTSNLLHGSYPSQSWGPDLGSHWMKVDFGREVTVSEVVMTMRAHNGHDTYYKNATLSFSDGSSVSIQLQNTADKQAFSFDPVKTTYVLFEGSNPVDITGEDWVAVTEFEVYGTSHVSSSESYVTTDVYVDPATGNDASGKGTKDAPFKTVGKAIDSKKSAAFHNGDAIRILLNGEALDENALLFGKETVFTKEGERLPIIIDGGKITLTKTKVASANSFIFKNLTLNTPADSAFFAGSGEVVFENVSFGNTTTSFYGDDFASSGAFDSWTKVPEGTITSITFGKGTAYSGGMAAVGGESTENSSKIVAKLVIDGATVEKIKARDAAGVSIQESVVEVKNGATVAGLTGIDGGDHLGDLTITVGKDAKDTSVVTDLIGAKGDYTLSGKASLNILGGTFGQASGKSVECTTSGAAGALGTVNTITGGTFRGGFIGVYTTGAMTSVGNVTNNVSGGTFLLSFVGGSAGYNRSAVIPKVTNTIGGNTKMEVEGGIFTDESGTSESVTYAFVGGSIGKGAVKIKNVVNSFSGSAQVYSGFGGARIFSAMDTTDYVVENITNHFSGGEIQSFYAGSRTGGAVKSIKNSLSNTKIGTFYAGTNGTGVNSGSSENTAISTTVERGTNITTFFGGTATGTVTGKILTTVNGGKIGTFYAGTKQGNVDGNVETTVNGGSIGTFFGGNEAGGTISGKVLTTVKGGEIATFYGQGKGGNATGETANTFLGGKITKKFVSGGLGATAGAINTLIPAGSTAVFEAEFIGGCEKGSATSNTVTVSGGTFFGAVSGTGIILSTETGSPVIYGNFVCENAVGGAGTLLLGKDAFVSAEKVTGTLKLNQTEFWTNGHKFFFAKDLSSGKVEMLASENRSIGSYKEDFEGGYSVTGISMTPVGAKLMLDSRVGVKFYFEKADVDAIADRFTYSVKLGSGVVAKGTYADLEEENGLYALSFNGIGLSDFDTEFDVIATGLYDPESDDYNSILKLAEIGAGSCEKQSEKVLFRALADLGRVVHDPSSRKYLSLGYKQIKPASSGEKGEEGALLTFTGKNLLMNDAIGIRLYGSAKQAEDLEGLKVMVNDTDVTKLCDVSEPYLDGEKYKFTVDIFVSVTNMQSNLKITLLDKNDKACLKLSDQVDWIAQTIINKEPDNILAKQVLIYIQKVYNYINDIQHIITPPSSGGEGEFGVKVAL